MYIGRITLGYIIDDKCEGSLPFTAWRRGMKLEYLNKFVQTKTEPSQLPVLGKLL